LSLPPYSPDFNPIEEAFSKIKAVVRKAARLELGRLWL
jgi:transposase